MEKDEAQVASVGLVGHGMLLAPVCPCRFAIEPPDTLWIIRSPRRDDIRHAGQAPGCR